MSEWINIKFDKLAKKIKSGGTPKTTNKLYYKGDIPFVSIEDITASKKYINKTKKNISIEGLESSNTWLVPEKSILYSIYASLGEVVINDVECATNQAILGVVPNNEIIDTEFLFYKLLDLKNKIHKYTGQTTQSNLSATIVRNFEFEIPKEPNEQSQIATILSILDSAIASTEQLIAKYQRIKTGLLHDLLTRGIDEQGNLRSEKTHKFKDSKLGRIPVEWECKPLGEEIFAIDPQPDHRTPALVQNGIPYLGINDIDENGNIDLKSCRKVGRNVLDKQIAAFTINKGDIIFGKIGTIGQPKVLPTFKNNFTLSANVILIQPKATPEFIYWLLVSEIINRQISNTVHTTSQPAFGMEKIRNLSIIFPKEDERKMISEILQKQECSINKFQQNLSKLQSIKAGLMQDLLSGKVRTK